MRRRTAALAGSATWLWLAAAQAQGPAGADQLQPEDWAYQTLNSHRQRHGCATTATEAALNAGEAISRFSAAELLNTCVLQSGSQDPGLAALMQQLSPELSRLQSNLDELEAIRFSATTKLRGLASFVAGSNRFDGSDTSEVLRSRSDYGATLFNYDLKLILDTSFTGQDLLRARLRGGNFNTTNNSFHGAGPSKLSTLETAFQEKSGPDVVAINRLYYQFPLGKGWTASIGPRVGQLDLFALRPSVYPEETILDWFTLKGAPAAYNYQLGAGGGLWWQSRHGFSISANYVAGNGAKGNPSEGGIGSAASASTGSLQVDYRTAQWGAAAVVSAVQNLGGVIDYATNFTLNSFNNPGLTTAYGLSAYWQPLQSGWLPSISAGWGFNRTNYDSTVNTQGLVADSQSWSIGLQWSDVLSIGNTLGMAVGQPIFATALYGGAQPRDGNTVWEWWYKIQLSDNLAITPALFLLNRPLGADTPAGQTFRQIGALLKTTLYFTSPHPSHHRKNGYR